MEFTAGWVYQDSGEDNAVCFGAAGACLTGAVEKMHVTGVRQLPAGRNDIRWILREGVRLFIVPSDRKSNIMVGLATTPEGFMIQLLQPRGQADIGLKARMTMVGAVLLKVVPQAAAVRFVELVLPRTESGNRDKDCLQILVAPGYQEGWRIRIRSGMAVQGRIRAVGYRTVECGPCHAMVLWL